MLFVIFGGLSAISIDIIGKLRLTDVVLPVLCLLIWAIRGQIWSDKVEKRILLLGILWLISQLISDMYRGTTFYNMARGNASIFLFLLQFACLYQIARSKIRVSTDEVIKWLLYGLAVGGMLAPLLSPTELTQRDPWKFGYGIPVSIAFVTFIRGVAASRDALSRAFAGTVMGVFAAVSVWLGFRALAGALLVTAVVMGIRFTSMGAFLARLRTGPFAVLAGVLGSWIIFVGVVNAYGWAAENGWLGQKQKQKYEAQSTGRFGLLIGGRLDLIPALFAITDSPIIGYGSWAENSYYRSFLLDVNKYGYNWDENELKSIFEKSDEIPHHSHILQAWLWAGISGIFFWLYVLWIIISSVLRYYRIRSPLLIPITFLGAMSVWDIFFSVFGSHKRYEWAVRLTIFLLAWYASSTQTRRGPNSLGE